MSESAFLAPRIPSRRDEEKLAKLKAITGPFMLRRLKSDRSIIKDLPDKVPTFCIGLARYCSSRFLFFFLPSFSNLDIVPFRGASFPAN